MTPIRAIVLTFNEEIHLARCLASLKPHCQEILVIDSGSTDRTLDIAAEFGARIIEAPWVNHSVQVNRAIAALAGSSGWLMRVDADEVLEPIDSQSLATQLDQQPPDICGLLVRRRIIFMGRRIAWGGIEPSWQLRLWRAGTGRSEQRWMDEHILVSGGVARSSIILTDHNLNALDWWTAKHNRYASLEAIDTLASEGLLPADTGMAFAGASPQAKAKRWLKRHVYARLPSGIRALAYFLYRYVLRLGFLDGMPGYYFHILQGFWYRSLVDAKLSEIRAIAEREQCPIEVAIRRATGIDLAP